VAGSKWSFEEVPAGQYFRIRPFSLSGNLLSAGVESRAERDGGVESRAKRDGGVESRAERDAPEEGDGSHWLHSPESGVPLAWLMV
jgi:hypothetical protein